MGRASRAQAAEHREQLVAAASRLFREKGFTASLAELTGAVGLTTGAFYRQFASKDALLGEATEHAFTELRALLDGFGAAHRDDHDAARAALIDHYLSAGHRDDAAHGCPATGLCADVSRTPVHTAARTHYADGVRQLAGWLDPARAGTPQDPSPTAPADTVAQASDEALATLCTMVGALVLARATNGTALSDRILDSARETLTTTGD